MSFPVETIATTTEAGGVVTSVDSGALPGTFLADGNQINQLDYSPYPVDTPLNVDSSGFYTTQVQNYSLKPVITVNTSQIYEVFPADLMRTSLIFERPTQWGRFRQPLDWRASDEINEVWGTLQVTVGGVDVTYFRDHPTEFGAWSSNEPNGDVATTLKFKQISWYERTGEGALSWFKPGADVDIILHRPNGTQKTLFEGLVVSKALSGAGMGITMEVIGVLYQANHSPYIMEMYKKHRDIGTAIADILDDTVSRNFQPCNRPNTGIPTNIRGSGGQRLSQAVQDILATAWTPDLAGQWTLTNEPGRQPVIKLKDKTTRHWTMALGNSDLNLNLREDWQQLPDIIWGSGVGPDGCNWYNAKFPGTPFMTVSGEWPLPIDQFFVPGSGTTGFFPFSYAMRVRGYAMVSQDTYRIEDIPLVRDAQQKAGVRVDDKVGSQTWLALIGVGPLLTEAQLDNAHISPLAVAPWAWPRLEAPDGRDLGANPMYDASRLNIGKYVEYGQDTSLLDGMDSARREIQAKLANDPMWVGSAILNGDPEEGSRWEMRAGQNIFIRFLHAPANSPWTTPEVDEGILFHISQARVTPGSEVSLELSYLGHDMTTLAALKRRDRDTTDPALRDNSTRGARITQDAIIPWDCESGSGYIPIIPIEGGTWTVVPIPAGQVGRIVSTLALSSPLLDFKSMGVRGIPALLDAFGNVISPAVPAIPGAFECAGAIPGAKEFAVGVYSKPVTAQYLNDTLGDPFLDADIYKLHAEALANDGLLMAYGSGNEPAGYYPGYKSEGDSMTGKMRDDRGWDWTAEGSPYVHVAFYSTDPTRVTGYLRNDPLSA